MEKTKYFFFFIKKKKDCDQIHKINSLEMKLKKSIFFQK